MFQISKCFKWLSSLHNPNPVFVSRLFMNVCCSIRCHIKHEVTHNPTFSQLPCINVLFVEISDPAGIKFFVSLLLAMWVPSRGQKSCNKKHSTQEFYNWNDTDSSRVKVLSQHAQGYQLSGGTEGKYALSQSTLLLWYGSSKTTKKKNLSRWQEPRHWCSR